MQADCCSSASCGRLRLAGPLRVRPRRESQLVCTTRVCTKRVLAVGRAKVRQDMALTSRLQKIGRLSCAAQREEQNSQKHNGVVDQLEHNLQSHDQDAPHTGHQVSYADDVVSRSASGLQHRLDILQWLWYVQNTGFNDIHRSHTNNCTCSHQQLQIVTEYTYLSIVLHKSGPHKHAIHKFTAAGKRALFAMQYRCSLLGIDDTSQ